MYPPFKDVLYKTLLHFAARYNHLELVQYLAAKQQVDPLCQTKHGSTPLHLACQGGNIDIVRYLMNEMKKYPSLKDMVYIKDHAGWTPLHCAAKCNHLEIVQYLVSKEQVDPLFQTKRGSTPLLLVCISGNIDVVRYVVNEMSRW